MSVERKINVYPTLSLFKIPPKLMFNKNKADQRNVGTDNDTDTYRNDKRRKFNRSQFEPSIDLKFEELNFDKEISSFSPLRRRVEIDPKTTCNRDAGRLNQARESIDSDISGLNKDLISLNKTKIHRILLPKVESICKNKIVKEENKEKEEHESKQNTIDKRNKRKTQIISNKCSKVKLEFLTSKINQVAESGTQTSKKYILGQKVVIPQRLISPYPGRKIKNRKANVEKCFTITQMNNRSDMNNIKLISKDFEKFDIDISTPFMNETIKRRDRETAIRLILDSNIQENNYKSNNRNNRSHNTDKK